MSNYQILIHIDQYNNSQKIYDDFDIWIKDLKTNVCPVNKIFLISNFTKI